MLKVSWRSKFKVFKNSGNSIHAASNWQPSIVNALKSVFINLFYHYQKSIKCRSPSWVANNCRIIVTKWKNNGKTVADKRVEKTKNKSGAIMSCSRGGCDSGANDRGSSSLKCSSSRRRPHSWHSSIGSPHHYRIKRMLGKWFKSVFL